jgi:predicted permease
MERLLQDLRFALRVLVRDRAFSVTVLLTLAVCIGANAVIFAVVNSVLLRPLPVPEADRLVLLYNSYPKAGVERASSGVPDYYDRLRETDVFEELALIQQRGVTVGTAGSAERLTGMGVRPSFFRMLRAAPLKGRTFTEDEGEIGSEHRVVLSYELWQRTFGASEAAVGGDLRINGVAHRIVGVMPAGFHFLSPEVELWTPLAFTPDEKSDDSRHNNSWTMIGRLKPGASLGQAQQQIDALNARNLERFPALKEILLNAGFRTAVTPLQEDLVRDVRRTLYLLWGGVLFVLAIGAVNVTNLVLIRSTARMKELATRHALGAGLARLTRQLLTETLLLTLLGGAAGAILGYWGLAALAGASLEALPRSSEIQMDRTVGVFTMALALAVGLLVGLVPVVSLRGLNLSQAFREEGRSGTSSRGARAARRALVVSQVAFAFMLLAGAGLLLASFERVLNIDPGFDPDRLLTARIALPATRYPEDVEVRTFITRLLPEVRRIPGVESAGLTSNLPFGGDFSDSVILAEGYRMAPGESLISPYRVIVSPGYLDTLRVPLLKGRLFHDSDTEPDPKNRVVIVDARLAAKFWPGRDPVGRRMFQPENTRGDIMTPAPDQTWLTVIGVVGETKMAGLVSNDTRAGTYYFPANHDIRRTLTLAIRTAGDPNTVAPAVRRALTSVDPELPLYSVRTMKDRIDESLADRRTPMMMAVMFGGVALFLAATGLYGVLAYQVTQRRKEIGIRMALGSEPGGIFGLILREGLVLLGVGLAIGGGGAFAIRQAMESQLYGVSAMDPFVLASVAAMLGLVALVACAVPARRAARIDPMVALTE